MKYIKSFQYTTVEGQQDMGAPEHFPPVTHEIWEILVTLETYEMMSTVTGFLPRTLGFCMIARQTDLLDDDSCHLQGMMITTLHTALPHAKSSMCSN